MGGDNFLLRGNSSNTLSALTVNHKLMEQEDIMQQIQDQEQEIIQLRKHLAQYAVKVARIQTEKSVLETRVAAMYKGFDKQQQDLVEASSKALAYKQDIMEENVRLRYALQLARDEDTIFVSSLVPLLADQSFHPANLDAYSVVSSLRIMFKHLQERINIVEKQVRDGQYQPVVIHSHGNEWPLNDSSRPEIADPSFPPSLEQVNGDNVVNSHHLPSILEEEQEHNDSEQDVDNESDDFEDVDIIMPLPTVEELQITGDPFPGNKIQASGYSRNGTTRCGFEWVRYLQDGSMKYIEGAKHPAYTVTADDLDNYLAVIVQPLDDRQRKGEVVKCFANDNKKITCHPDMLREIERSVSVGRVSFKVLVLNASRDTWEPGILDVKKSGYRIKVNGPNNGVVVVNDKYAPATAINLAAEDLLQFCIVGPEGVERYLYADCNESGFRCSRDAIVLTMRLFVKRAVDKMLGKKKKRGLFF